MKLTKKNPIPRFRTTLALSLLLGACSSGYSQEAETEEEIFELSPFEVTNSENDIGYYSERTLAGSRLNSKVADLAASITVVTMQQMVDTAATNINDVFLYESGTEGFGNYTATGGSLADRGTVKDAGAGYSFANTGESASAGGSNRVRGLSAPTTTQNFYDALSQIPFDAYNTRSVEINRGPNSILSGLGSPAGIVNQSTASAALDVDSSQIVFRIDDRGSLRASFNHNQSLIENKLAIYVAGLSEKEKFERKPSYDDTSRFYAAIKYKPFEKTNIRASWEKYSNNNRRPNSLTPSDFVTPWLEAGRPAYDNQTRTVTVLDTGEVIGPFYQDTSAPGYDSATMFTGGRAFYDEASPTYVPGIVPSRAGTSRPIVQINPNGTFNAYEGYTRYGWNANANYPQSLSAPATADRTQADWDLYSMQHTFSDFYNWDDNVANFVAPPVTDQSIYNWEEYNMLAMNYGSKEAETVNIEFEQQITDNLFASVGWFRQEYSDIQNYTVQQQTGATLYIDTNLNLPNGQPNPNFGLPYLEDYLPDTWTNEVTNDNFRAQVAYELDFSENDNWSKWLGDHRFLGLYSTKKVESLRLRLRGSTVGGDPRFLQWNDYTTTGNYLHYRGTRLYRNYYLANPGDPQATVSSGAATHWGQPNYMGPGYQVIQDFGGPSSYPVTLYNWETGQFEETTTEVATLLHDATSGRNVSDLESKTLGWQGYFLDNRLITTFGWRKDTVDLRNTVGGAGLSRTQIGETGFVLPENTYDRWSFESDGVTTRNEDVVSGETASYGAVAVPLRWEGGDIRVHYNESDNFNPPPSAQTDSFGTLLEKPIGEGKDYGFSITAFDNKFTAKFNWFENSADNERTGAANTLIQRLNRVDSDYMKQWAEQIAHRQLGYWDYGIAEMDGNRPPLTETQQAELQSRVEAITGLRYDWPAGLNIGATQTTIAEGMEIQLIYNPTRNWNIKMTAAQNETTTQNVAPQYDAWRAERYPVWQAATSPLTAADDPNHDGDNNPNTYFFNGSDRPADITNFWTANGYNSEFDTTNPSAFWYNIGDFFDAAVESQVALAKAMEGVASPNLREWRVNMITNYRFTDGVLKDFSVGGSLRWESESSIGYYGLAKDPDNPTRLNAPDPSRPFYDDGNVNVDLWASYRVPLANENIDWKIQLNIRNVQDSGELRPVSVDYAGNINAYRIIDPRQIFLTNTFTF